VLTFDSRLTWKAHINETKAKAFRRINLLKWLAGIKWGADQGMLLRVHEMMVLSALEYGSAANNTQLKRLEPVHNKGLRIALGAFCVYRTENIMFETKFESLAERRKQKIIKTAIHVAKNSSHPVNRWFKEKEAYEDYALKPKLSRPFFVRALDLDTVESARQLEHPPWIGDNMENVNTQMTTIPKGTTTARLKAEMEQTIEEEGLEEYVRVYTDGSLMEDRVGSAIICEAREIKIRQPKQMSIFNAEAVAILEPI
jgi:hypothetical protein